MPRFGNIVNVSTIPKEKSAMVKYQREIDAKKAFECKEIPFNQPKIEIVHAGKVHSFEEDIRIEAEQRKQREEAKKARFLLQEAKKGHQQNLTNLLNIHLELKHLVTDETMMEKLKESLEQVKHKLAELKNVENVEDLGTEEVKPQTTQMQVSRRDSLKVDLKSINEVFKTFGKIEKLSPEGTTAVLRFYSLADSVKAYWEINRSENSEFKVTFESEELESLMRSYF